MFNYVTVEFPNTTLPPAHVYSMTFYQNRYQHEIATIQFRDWNVNYDVVSTGSPVKFTVSTVKKSRSFYGYIHHVNVNRTPSTFLTEIVVVGASMVMKNESQQVYKGLSADGIIKQIAKRNNFACFTVAHPRIYPQVAQAGHTDWEIMVRLAKQSGYSLRTENTEIYFQPMLYEFTNKRSEASYFYMNEANNPSGSTIYSFEPVISDSMPQDNETKAAIAVNGLDTNSVSSMSITQQKRAANTKYKTTPEFFDKHATDVVVLDATVAAYEAKAAEDRTVFPYRATVEVLGAPDVRPDAPVYLDGLGNYYSGYWTVLGTEHRVRETERNTQTYTTILHVGTDSLGTTTTWIDGKNIVKPNTTPSRTIIPGVAQTVIVPTTVLRRTTPNLGPQSNGVFGVQTNRAKGVANGPVWVTGTLTLDPISQPAGSTASYSNPALSKIPSVL
jgi:hypothetical protein